jgi:hypothetical protein
MAVLNMSLSQVTGPNVSVADPTFLQVYVVTSRVKNDGRIFNIERALERPGS